MALELGIPLGIVSKKIYSWKPWLSCKPNQGWCCMKGLFVISISFAQQNDLNSRFQVSKFKPIRSAFKCELVYSLEHEDKRKDRWKEKCIFMHRLFAVLLETPGVPWRGGLDSWKVSVAGSFHIRVEYAGLALLILCQEKFGREIGFSLEIVFPQPRDFTGNCLPPANLISSVEFLMLEIMHEKLGRLYCD